MQSYDDYPCQSSGEQTGPVCVYRWGEGEPAVICPVRDLPMKDLAMLCHWLRPAPVRPPRPPRRARGRASLNALAETFVAGLQSTLPSTVPTILRTALKLQVRKAPSLHMDQPQCDIFPLRLPHVWFLYLKVSLRMHTFVAHVLGVLQALRIFLKYEASLLAAMPRLSPGTMLAPHWAEPKTKMASSLLTPPRIHCAVSAVHLCRTQT